MSADSEIQDLTALLARYRINIRVAREELRIEKDRAEESRRIFRNSVWRIEDTIRIESDKEKDCERRLNLLTENMGI